MSEPTDCCSPVLLTRSQAAKYLAISVRTLFTLTQDCKIKSVRIGRRSVRYRRADLDAYVESRCRGGA